MRASGSRSATAMRSSTLWMLALVGPNSTSCGQMSAMKRPSEVPPVVDSSMLPPVTAAAAALNASQSSPRGVKKGLAPSVQAIS